MLSPPRVSSLTNAVRIGFQDFGHTLCWIKHIYQCLGTLRLATALITLRSGMSFVTKTNSQSTSNDLAKYHSCLGSSRLGTDYSFCLGYYSVHILCKLLKGMAVTDNLSDVAVKAPPSLMTAQMGFHCHESLYPHMYSTDCLKAVENWFQPAYQNP